MASTAMTGIAGLLRFARQPRAQRGGRHPVLERLAAVHEEHGDLLAIGCEQDRIAVDVHLVEVERRVGANRVDDRAHLVAEVAFGPAIEREAHAVVDTPTDLKYRPSLGAARPVVPVLPNDVRRDPYR